MEVHGRGWLPRLGPGRLPVLAPRVPESAAEDGFAGGAGQESGEGKMNGKRQPERTELEGGSKGGEGARGGAGPRAGVAAFGLG